MRIVDITDDSLKQATNKSVSSLHYRIHQLYGHRKTKRIDVKLLRDKHALVVADMKRRGMKPKCRGLSYAMKKVSYYMEGIDDDE